MSVTPDTVNIYKTFLTFSCIELEISYKMVCKTLVDLVLRNHVTNSDFRNKTYKKNAVELKGIKIYIFHLIITLYSMDVVQ